MEFKPKTSLPPPSDKTIAETEEYHQITLPPDYIQVLKHHNGAKLLTSVFGQGRRERLIDRMLCLLDDARNEEVLGCYDIEVVLTQVGARMVDDENLVGSNVIPIAALGAGDLVCLDFRKSRTSPTVCVWDHEQSDDFRPHLEKIADSFSEFTRLLRRSS